MLPQALLITTPAVDFGAFLGVSQQALGYSPSQVVDASPLQCSETERFLSCLACLTNQSAGVGLSPHLLTHLSFSLLVVADDRDLLDILQITGMPFVVTDTISRGVQLAVVTGTLSQWRDAVKSGSARGLEYNVRTLFNRVMSLFEAVGLNVWHDFEAYTMPDKTFYLEHKPSR
jgi:hypothetical protein